MPRPRQPGPGSASPRWITGSPPARHRRAAGRLRSLTEDKIEALARKSLAILPNRLARGPGRRYRYDILGAAGETPSPGAGQAGLRADLLNQVIHDNLAIGRPDQVGLVFGRRIIRKGPHATPGRFRTRVITEGVTPSLHVDYKNSKIKQYHKLGKAIRTETTINETRDFGIGKRLHQPARTAADRLHRQPAPAGRPDTQP